VTVEFNTTLMRSKELLSPVIAAVLHYVPLVTRGSMGGHVCLALCKSITTNGKSTLCSHSTDGHLGHAISPESSIWLSLIANVWYSWC
jgi:hypothetical protein